MDTIPQQLLQNDSSTHPTIMYTTKLKIHVPVVPLVETQLIKCLQAEQITFFPLMEGLNSCITCQIHDLLALLPAAVLTIFTVTGVPFSECVCVFSSHSFWTSSSLDVPAGVTQEEGHTGFLIHLPSAVRALIFVARRIQPFLSLVDREVEFCVLTN